MRLPTIPLIALALAGVPATARPAAPPPGAMRGTFISPMGEPFHADGDAPAPDLAWFQGADRDHDGRVTLAEFRADAARFFATLDVDRSGEIDPQELERYETEIAPEIRVGSSFGGYGGGGGGGRHDRGSRGGGDGGRGGGGMGSGGMGGRGGMDGGGMHGGGAGDDSDGDGGGRRSSGGDGAPAGRRGAGRFGYLDLPEPVAAADTNLNRGISLKEFDEAAQQRFHLLDTVPQGFLTRDTLPRLNREDHKPRSRAPAPEGDGGE